jgi:hypothetical protein
VKKQSVRSSVKRDFERENIFIVGVLKEIYLQ